jgi:hypothetical protein
MVLQTEVIISFYRIFKAFWIEPITNVSEELNRKICTFITAMDFMNKNLSLFQSSKKDEDPQSGTCDLLVITKKYKEKESTYIITVNSYTILLMRYQEA